MCSAIAAHVATAFCPIFLGHPKAHVLVEGELVSSTSERPNGKGKRTVQTKLTSWSIRADVVRKLDRGEPDPASPLTPAAEAHEEPTF